MVAVLTISFTVNGVNSTGESGSKLSSSGDSPLEHGELMARSSSSLDVTSSTTTLSGDDGGALSSAESCAMLV